MIVDIVLHSTDSTEEVEPAVIIMIEECGDSVSVLSNVALCTIPSEGYNAGPGGGDPGVNLQIKTQSEVRPPLWD